MNCQTHRACKPLLLLLQLGLLFRPLLVQHRSHLRLIELSLHLWGGEGEKHVRNTPSQLWHRGPAVLLPRPA